MKLVIEIDEKYYESTKSDDLVEGTIMASLHAIRNGTPLPKGHGDLKDADYIINHICESKDCYKENCKGKQFMRCPDIMWVADAPTIIESDKED